MTGADPSGHSPFRPCPSSSHAMLHMRIYTCAPRLPLSSQVDRLSQTLAKPGLANFHVVVIAAGVTW